MTEVRDREGRGSGESGEAFLPRHGPIPVRYAASAEHLTRRQLEH